MGSKPSLSPHRAARGVLHELKTETKHHKYPPSHLRSLALLSLLFLQAMSRMTLSKAITTYLLPTHCCNIKGAWEGEEVAF